ncbi:HAAS signaling domain-containing protein [Kitasatospora sp. NPDC057015]|uniref:HAAS signaling domain-containing protein n=1 Tax=Kitasatospora sp. NPDC057015 TaxID=3346001 RepID=UPI00362970C4
MNDTLAHPLVRSYLSSVAELTAALPDDRRQELLADLREHIEVALADSGATEQESVRQVLGRLGAPGEIAAAALAEEADSPPAPESGGSTAVTLGLIVLALPAALVPGIGLLLAPVAAVAALVRLWNSAQWSRSEKRQATLLTLAPVVTAPALAAVLSLALGGLTPAVLLAALLLSAALPAVAAVRLGRSAGRLRRRVGHGS